jgi:uncharacterized protein (DUF1810 family)
MSDPFALERFVEAQERIFKEVLAELRRGSKQGHWIWFIFPQMKGLGSSSTSTYYGIASRAEAEAYLAHPILGPRLIECTELVNLVRDRTIEEIFGVVDALKFRSSMTLFSEVSDDGETFKDALKKYFGGEPDRRTLDLLGPFVK